MKFDTRNGTVNGQKVDEMPRFRVTDKATGEPIHRCVMADDKTRYFAQEIKTVDGNKKLRTDQAPQGLTIEVLPANAEAPEPSETPMTAEMEQTMRRFTESNPQVTTL